MSAVTMSVRDALRAHAWVTEAHSASRMEHGVVVVLNATGVAALHACGLPATLTALKRALLENATPVPRVWRLLDEPPRQAIDEIVRAAWPLDPIVMGQSQIDGNWVVELKVPLDLRCFMGHFASSPVLPGIVQLGWALALASTQFKTPRLCHTVETLKFQQFLLPGERVSLALRSNEERDKLYFAYRCGARNYSSGRVVWKVPT